MKNYLLQIEYFGKNYCGWQHQPHAPNIQQELEKALSKIANHNVDIICAGRTDAGVHATSQIINFLSDADRHTNAWQRAANSLLPKDIKVLQTKEVSLDLNARFSALSRTYNYVIYNAPVSSPVFAQHSLWENRSLNINKMSEACKYLIGKQDFSSFRSSQCQSNTALRNIKKAEFFRCGRFVIFEITSNAFLHHMIRNIIGSFIKVGLSLKEPAWIGELLKLKDRTQAAETARPQGLYFVGVEYSGFDFRRPVSKLFI